MFPDAGNAPDGGPAAAAVWGAYVHGRVGERLTAEVGRTGFLAREVARPCRPPSPRSSWASPGGDPVELDAGPLQRVQHADQVVTGVGVEREHRVPRPDAWLEVAHHREQVAAQAARAP